MVFSRFSKNQKSNYNVIIGLHVVCDTLIIKLSHAPGTVIIIKNSVPEHNPAEALYTGNSYCKRLFQKNKMGFRTHLKIIQLRYKIVTNDFTGDRIKWDYTY